jgi:hypothetical protein
MNRMQRVLGELESRINAAIEDTERAGVTKRIWKKDAALWKDDEPSQKIIKNSLGWLTVPDEMLAVVDELTSLLN